MPVALHGNLLVLPADAPADELVANVPGATFDGDRWTAPVTSLSAVRGFARRHHLDLDITVLSYVPARPKVTVTGSLIDVGTSVEASFAYDRVLIAEVKKIPGVTWNRTTKAWAAPKTSLGDAIAFAERFNLDIPPPLRAEWAAICTRRAQMLDASRSHDAEIDLPTVNGDLRGYQKAGVLYLAAARRALIGDDPGLGKTLTSLAAVEHLDRPEDPTYPVVVVCPPKLTLNWAFEYQRWLPHRRVAVVKNRSEFPEPGYDVVVIGWSNVAHWADKIKKHKAYILDEIHWAKTSTSQRAKAMKKARRSAPQAVFFGLTGTPVDICPAELAPQLDIIGRIDDFGGTHGFLRRYCDGHLDDWGKFVATGATHLDELHQRLRQTCFIRRTKDEVLHELPPVQESVLWLDLEGAHRTAYEKADSDFVQYITEQARLIALELGEDPRSAVVRARVTADAKRVPTLRRLAAKGKLDFVEDWTRERVEAGRKVILAAHHRDIVDALAKPWGGLKIQGGMSVGDVEAAKALFQQGSIEEAPVIVLSIDAAREGHTLTASQDVGFVELPWTYSRVQQTYSRAHRLGQTGSVTATYFLAQDTIDAAMFDTVLERRGIAAQITDGVVPDDPVEVTAGEDAVIDAFVQRALESV